MTDLEAKPDFEAKTDIEALPFWKAKTLEQLSPAEWESLCDGCGRCCLVKLEEEGSGRTYFTDVACFMLECHSCQCSDYPGRKNHVPDCVTLTPELARTIDWLPPTCAYKLVADGEDLYWWHPLISGDPQTVHAAGVSVRGRVAFNDKEVGVDDGDAWEDHIVRWPMRIPKSARAKPVRGEPPRSRPAGGRASRAGAGQDAPAITKA